MRVTARPEPGRVPHKTMAQNIFNDHFSSLLVRSRVQLWVDVPEAAYSFSCMLHGADTRSGGSSSIARLCPRSEAHCYPSTSSRAVSEERVGRGRPCRRACFPWARQSAVPTSQTYDGQMVVRRAQVLCECALNNGSPLDDQR